MIHFKGRPDGLGNRFEELILLKILQNRTNENITYYWNNIQAFNYRKYDIKIKIKNIDILELKQTDLSSINYFQHLRKSLLDITQDEMLFAAKEILPTFQIKDNVDGHVGLHIRLGDKIRHPPRVGEMSIEESNYSIQKSIEFIKKNKIDKLFICSDDISIINYLKSNLDIEIISGTKDEYMDFFLLSKTKYIIMGSKISSFAFTAALVGNKDIYNFFDINTLSNENKDQILRYKTKLKTIL